MRSAIYCDSSVFLAWLKNEPGRADVVDSVFEQAASGETIIVTSALAIAEVLNLRGANSPIERSERAKVRNLFLNEWIAIKNVNRKVAEISQEVIWDCSVKPKDGIHVATALIFRVPTLYAYDGRLARQISTPYGNLNMSEPVGAAQGELLKWTSEATPSTPNSSTPPAN